MLLLIVGITGDLGQRLAWAALKRGLEIRGLGRNPKKLGKDLTSRLESFVTSDSYQDIAALDRALTGVDGVICAYPMDPVLYLDGGLLLLRAAERAQVRLFVAPTWTSNWTRIAYGEFEVYDSILAFRDHASRTSPINPVYIINGAFAEYTLAPGGPAFESDGLTAKLRYWGDVLHQKVPWTTMDDAAHWTIELIATDATVQAGEGGIFQFQSGCDSYESLAKVYEQTMGVKVELVCEGDLTMLRDALERERRVTGRSASMQYLYLAWSLIAADGRWQLQAPVSHLKHEATTFAQHLAKRAGKTPLAIQ
ncbi:hypothetical protein BJY04DRAFT_56493 [Aspergillus karnatakaensis]|uniref:uncharacterized protein n=1 Tax=Aspergillus karnatakaensis TaxID=1810916 RepID=UPI003CCD7F48